MKKGIKVSKKKVLHKVVLIYDRGKEHIDESKSKKILPVKK